MIQKDNAVEIKNTDKQAPYCPVCKSRNYIIPIIYGKPTKELLEQWGKKEIELGGSLTINDGQPPWTCTRCKIFVYALEDATPQEPISQNPD